MESNEELAGTGDLTVEWRDSVLMSPTGTEVLAEGSLSQCESPGTGARAHGQAHWREASQWSLGREECPEETQKRESYKGKHSRNVCLLSLNQPELGECKVTLQKAAGEEAGRTFQRCRCTAGNPESSSSSCLGEHRGLPIKPWGTTPWM